MVRISKVICFVVFAALSMSSFGQVEKISAIVHCDAPTAREGNVPMKSTEIVSYRIFVVEENGTLGSRLAVIKKCGERVQGFTRGRLYVVKAVDKQNRLSARSSEFRIPLKRAVAA